MSGTENIGLTTIQRSFKPSLWPRPSHNSLIFVYHWRELPQVSTTTKFATNTHLSWQSTSLSQQKYACCNNTFVTTQKYISELLSMTNICCIMQVFVMTKTKVLLWQAYFCHDKRHVLLWQTHVCRDKSKLVATKDFQFHVNFCHDKIMFVVTNTCLSQQNTSFVTTSIVLSRQKTCLSQQNFCHDKILVAAPANHIWWCNKKLSLITKGSAVLRILLNLKWSYFDYRNTQCDPDLEDSKTIFSYYTPAHCDASSYKVCLQKVKQFRGSCLDRHSMKFWTFHVTLTLNTSKQPFHMRIQLMTMYHQTKSDCKRIN